MSESHRAIDLELIRANARILPTPKPGEIYHGENSNGSRRLIDPVGRPMSTAEPLFDPFAARVERFMDSAPPERRMIVPDWLPLDVVGLLASMGGVGKSFLLYQLGFSATTGLPFLGMPLREVGAALMLFAEDDEHELHRRHAQILQHAEAKGPRFTRGVLAARLHVVSRVAETNLLTAGREGEVARTKMVDQLIAAAQLIPDLKLIAIDPVSRFRGGRANSEEDSTAFVTALEAIRAATGATVLASVHVNKASSSQAGESDQTAVRGSSALVDGVRWVAQMQRMRREQAADYNVRVDDAWNYVRLDLPKSNYSRPWSGMWLRREAGGVLVPAELEYCKETRKEAKADAKYSDVLERLRELLSRDGPMTRNHIESEYAGTSGVLGAGEKTVRSIIARAVAEGTLIEQDDPGSIRGRLLTLGGA